VKFRGEIWRQRLWVWLPALLFFLANVGAFAVYRVGYAGRIDSLDEQLDDQQRTLDQLTKQQREAQAMLTRVQTNEQQVRELYAERLSSRSRRLTLIHTEVKEMARKAGLVPRALGYPEQDIEELGLIKRSFIFNVDGTYVELRKFINLLEASRSFLSLDEVALSSNSEGAELNIALKLSTLFARESEDLPVATAADDPLATADNSPGGSR
jgi:Tfp pilus assembly protein PilO